MAAIKRIVLGFLIAVVALALFIIIFPLVHNIETLNPTDVETDGKFLELDNGITVHYREAGKGEPLVLIHGLTSSSYSWVDIMPKLSGQYHVIAPDVLGFGLTSKPADATYNYKAFADTIEKFLVKKGIKGKINIAGNSMGGGISIRYTLDHPERVNKLILVDSAGVDHGERNLMFTMMTLPVISNFMSSMTTEKSTGMMLKRCCFEDNSRVTPERAAAYTIPFKTIGASNAAKQTILQNDWAGLEPELGKISVPTLIIWGDQDKLIAPPIAYKFSRSIKGSELAMIEKCGHMPQEERPEETAGIILDFLKN